MSTGTHSFLGRGIGIGIAAAGVLIIIFGTSFYFYRRIQRRSSNSDTSPESTLNNINPEPGDITRFIPAEMGTTSNIRELESPREVLEMDEMGEAPRYTPFSCVLSRDVISAGRDDKDNEKTEGGRLVELEGDIAWRKRSLRRPAVQNDKSQEKENGREVKEGNAEAGTGGEISAARNENDIVDDQSVEDGATNPGVEIGKGFVLTG